VPLAGCSASGVKYTSRSASPSMLQYLRGLMHGCCRLGELQNKQTCSQGDIIC
jgi:hypothetical protein